MRVTVWVGVGVRVGKGVVVGTGVRVMVGVGVKVGAAVMVAATPASIVASISGMGVGVSVGSTAITIACTVASKFGVGSGDGVWLPNSQAIANKIAGSNTPKIFMGRILTQTTVRKARISRHPHETESLILPIPTSSKSRFRQTLYSHLLHTLQYTREEQDF